MTVSDLCKYKADCKELIPLLILSLVYIVLGLRSLDYFYFWDVVQQISNEATYYYKSDFATLIIPSDNEYGLHATGYHAPFLSIFTAALWKIFGRELWVSHVLTMFVASILIYNSYILCRYFVSKLHASVIVLTVLAESAIVTQYAIASPDFFILTGFVMILRGEITEKKLPIVIGSIIMAGCNMRGAFLLFILFASFFCVNSLLRKSKTLKECVIPYLPILTILLVYYTIYFIQYGWFFSNSFYSEHYTPLDSLTAVAYHIKDMTHRILENGRFVSYAIFTVVFLILAKRYGRSVFSLNGGMSALLLVMILNVILFLMLAAMTSMPFSGRYFMTIYFTMAVITFVLISKHFSEKWMWSASVVVLIASLTGHFWIYPDPECKVWDTTLAHTPYYNLKHQMFEYMEQNDIKIEDIRTGFPLYASRDAAELHGSSHRMYDGDKYYVYSNICNPGQSEIEYISNEDSCSFVTEFREWPVFVSIYKIKKNCNLIE